MSESPCRVLVVDDDHDLLQHLVRVLEQHGFATSAASSGAAAMELVGASRYDVVLSDVHMPGLCGLDLLSAIRRRDIDVPVVLMTGDPTLDTAIMAVEDGAVAYLTKPISRTTLVPTLERAAERGALARARRAALERETARS